MKGDLMRIGNIANILLGILILIAIGTGVEAIELKSSPFDLEQQKLRYQFTTQALAVSQDYYASTDSGKLTAGSTNVAGHKSPGKAFVLSALVPGLGQYYYGSKFKAAIFFAADVAAWTMQFTYHADGNRRTNAFNAFNDTHWSRTAYETYLNYGYGKTSDTSLAGYTEVSHHLPSTKTQQYYEMTGKYDQFSWGWNDAYRPNGSGGRDNLGNWPDTHQPYPQDSSIRVIDRSSAPISANRDAYEEMRYQANRKFKQATAMIMVSIANRVLSAFEALYTTTRHNRTAHAPDEFSQIKFNASLRSYSSKHDTPYLTVTYRFK
jgi:hypothetical protein